MLYRGWGGGWGGGGEGVIGLGLQVCVYLCSTSSTYDTSYPPVDEAQAQQTNLSMVHFLLDGPLCDEAVDGHRPRLANAPCTFPGLQVQIVQNRQQLHGADTAETVVCSASCAVSCNSYVLLEVFILLLSDD